MIVLDLAQSPGTVVARATEAPPRTMASTDTTAAVAAKPLCTCIVTVHEPGVASQSAANAAALATRLPPAKHVLELGAGSEAFEQAWRQRHGPPQTWLCCAEVSAVPAHASFDLICIHGDSFDLMRATAGLQALRHRLQPGGTLWCNVTAGGSHDDLAAMLEGDSTNPTAPRLAPLLRVLLDGGWLPTLAAETDARPVATSVPAIASLASELYGVPAATLCAQLGRRRLLLRATPQETLPPSTTPLSAGDFTVVVPVTREGQLYRNVLSSPGLRESGVRVLTVRGATSPAAAWDAALPLVDTPWVLLAHQDVYFPPGFGHRLAARLAAVAPAQRERVLAGFAGMAVNATADGYRPAGLVIDRTTCFDHPESAQAVSLDEFAVVMARDTVHRIDPALGWHLWATDLCLTAITRHSCLAHIWRIPVFHNSLNDYQLPPAFHAAGKHLLARHPSFGPIHTLCGVLSSGVTSQR